MVNTKESIFAYTIYFFIIVCLWELEVVVLLEGKYSLLECLMRSVQLFKSNDKTIVIVLRGKGLNRFTLNENLSLLISHATIKYKNAYGILKS